MQAPSCPIVWSGVHPTLLSEQTLKNDFVDVVVSGEGELVIKDIAHKLAKNQSLENVAGVTYKRDDRLMNRIEKYRWKHRYFGFPVELRMADALARKFKGFL